MSQDIAIKVENLSKVYKLYNKSSDRLKEALHWRGKQYHHDHYALTDVNLEVKKGETVGIIGKNGSGKSTLLKIITGVLTPTSGQVTVNGKISALLELGAGFNPAYTGIENIYLQCQLKGYTTAEIDEKLPDILSFADIGEFVYQPVKTYSSGMFVRLAFAVQACVEPDIFIVDEALAVGDIFFRQKCYQYFEHLRAKGTSILLVTHGMMDVEQFCQNALLLDHGNTVFFGNASQAVKHYYVTEQKEREATFLAIADSQKEQSPSQSVPSLEKDHTFWPIPQSFLNISTVKQVGNGWARCISVALCDENGESCFTFQQGETAHFYYAFEILEDIEVPVAGMVLQNSQGIIVHGKNTLQYNTSVPRQVKKGEILRFHHEIQLDLSWGEYTFQVSMSTLNHIHYNQRAHYSHEELDPEIIRICILTKIHHFQIAKRLLPNECTQLLHHGIANLPGNIKILNE